jgi:hypothetical protein
MFNQSKYATVWYAFVLSCLLFLLTMQIINPYDLVQFNVFGIFTYHRGIINFVVMDLIFCAMFIEQRSEEALILIVFNLMWLLSAYFAIFVEPFRVATYLGLVLAFVCLVWVGRFRHKAKSTKSIYPARNDVDMFAEIVDVLNLATPQRK